MVQQGGEHTDIGEDGTVDVSPSARFCVSEAQVIGNLYMSLQSIMEAERSSAGSAADGEDEVVDEPVDDNETEKENEPGAQG